MGIKNSRLFKRSSKSKSCNILMVGLDGAGKTTIANILTNKEIFDIKPTEGYTWMLNAYQCEEFTISLFDVGGGAKSRDLWLKTQCYIEGSLRGVVFVIDSSDFERIPEAREYLRSILIAFQNVKDPMVPVLVIANKQDVPGADAKHRITQMLEIANYVYLPSRYSVFGASAKNTGSLHAAMCKLCDMIRDCEKFYEWRKRYKRPRQIIRKK